VPSGGGAVQQQQQQPPPGLCQVCAWDHKKAVEACVMCGSPFSEPQQPASSLAVPPAASASASTSSAAPAPAAAAFSPSSSDGGGSGGGDATQNSSIFPLPPPTPRQDGAKDAQSPPPQPPKPQHQHQPPVQRPPASSPVGVSHLLHSSTSLFVDPWRTRHQNAGLLSAGEAPTLALGRASVPAPPTLVQALAAAAAGQSGGSSGGAAGAFTPAPISAGPFKPSGATSRFGSSNFGGSPLSF